MADLLLPALAFGAGLLVSRPPPLWRAPSWRVHAIGVKLGVELGVALGVRWQLCKSSAARMAMACRELKGMKEACWGLRKASWTCRAPAASHLINRPVAVRLATVRLTMAPGVPRTLAAGAAVRRCWTASG